MTDVTVDMLDEWLDHAGYIGGWIVSPTALRAIRDALAEAERMRKNEAERGDAMFANWTAEKAAREEAERRYAHTGCGKALGVEREQRVFAENAALAAQARVAAGVEVTAEHRDALTGRGKFPERADQCVCLGCKTHRALTEKGADRG